MSRKNSTFMPSQEFWRVCDWILAHYRGRPFGPHFLAWMLVGLSFGWLLAPDFRFVSLFAFGLSGCITCGILALLTYPVSDHHRLIVAGAGVGSAMIPLCMMLSPMPMVAPLCLLMGAMIGATGIIWLTPLRIWTFRRAQKKVAAEKKAAILELSDATRSAA